MRWPWSKRARQTGQQAAALASEGVVDPAQVFIMQQEYAVKVLGLEQQLAALRAEARKDENRVANARSERDALRAKVAEAAKICVAVQEVVTDPGMIGLAADILAALREGGSDD